MTIPPTRSVPIWETIAFTPLPTGWRNVYRDDDGPHAYPCPGVLIQEHRQDYIITDHRRYDATPDRRTHVQNVEPPYETQTVFADYGDGYLDVAMDAGNYLTTIGPGVAIPDAAPDTEAPV